MNLRHRVERLCQARRQKTTIEPLLIAQLPDGQWLAHLQCAWVDWHPNQELPPGCKVFQGIDPRRVA